MQVFYTFDILYLVCIPITPIRQYALIATIILSTLCKC